MKSKENPNDKNSYTYMTLIDFFQFLCYNKYTIKFLSIYRKKEMTTMLKGQSVGENYIKQKILSGDYTLNFKDAFQRFGSNFIEVSPIPKRVIALMEVPVASCFVAKPQA